MVHERSNALARKVSACSARLRSTHAHARSASSCLAVLSTPTRNPCAQRPALRQFENLVSHLIPAYPPLTKDTPRSSLSETLRVSPPVQTCTCELAHLLDCVLVRDRGSHATRCATQHDHDRDGRLFLAVIASSERPEIPRAQQVHRTRDLPSPMGTTCAACCHSSGTPTPNWQMQRFILCNQPLHRGELSVLSCLTWTALSVIKPTFKKNCPRS